MLQAELERVQEGKPMEDLDITRYRLDKPPLARRNDFAAWKKALENAHSQLGHQYNRCAWLAHQNVDVKAPWRQQLLSWQSCAALRRHAHNVTIQRVLICVQGGEPRAVAQVRTKGVSRAERQP